MFVIKCKHYLKKIIATFKNKKKYLNAYKYYTLHIFVILLPCNLYFVLSTENSSCNA